MKKSDFNILKNFICSIYKNLSYKETNSLLREIEEIFEKKSNKQTQNVLWSQSDFFLITYADSVIKKNKIA